MYGKVMSIPDDLMPAYFEFATDVSLDEIEDMRRGLAEGVRHPRDAKKRLARAVVEIWHGPKAAQEAEEVFERVFVEKDLPQDIPEATISADDAPGGQIRLVKLLVVIGLAESNREARRLVSQGGVTVDGTKLNDIDAIIPVRSGLVVRVGPRRFARIAVV
jgi:tyrosyl-tRNA synthetase